MKLGTVRVDGAERVVVAWPDDDSRAILLDREITMQRLILDRPAVELDPLRTVPAGDLEWLPPVPRPGKVICIALNNSANADRIMSGPSHPAAFTKPASSLLGHGRPIRLKKEYGRVHPEPELAVVIGAGGSGIARDAALGHVFGYTIINDLTSPTMRAEDTFHYRAIHPRPDGAEGSRTSTPGSPTRPGTRGPTGSARSARGSRPPTACPTRTRSPSPACTRGGWSPPTARPT